MVVFGLGFWVPVNGLWMLAIAKYLGVRRRYKQHNALDKPLEEVKRFNWSWPSALLPNRYLLDSD